MNIIWKGNSNSLVFLKKLGNKIIKYNNNLNKILMLTKILEKAYKGNKGLIQIFLTDSMRYNSH